MSSTLLLALNNTLHAFIGELSWHTLARRTRRCLNAVLATLLAVCAARYFNLPEIWWAAICAFSLTGLALSVALDLGVQQIIGTFGGTVFGYMLSRYAAYDIATFVLLIACLSAAGLYLATKRSAGYMWILATALAIYMMSASHAGGSVDLRVMAEALWINALIGTTAYLFVTALSHVLRSASRRLGQDTASVLQAPHAGVTRPSSEPNLGRVRHTIIGAVTLSILALLAWRYPIDGFAQAMITALVVLVVPVDPHGGWSLYGVVLRMCHRLLGCLAGCVVVFGVVPWVAGSLAYCLVALCVFVWLSSYLRFGHADVSYVGTQLGAVVILAFVHDRTWISDDISVAYHRLLGVVAGNIALAIVLAVVGGVFGLAAQRRGIEP
jgi:hypothetical protein